MRHQMKWRCGVLCILMVLGWGIFGAAAAAEITVTDIMPIYVEKGAQNVLVTLKAHVTNHGTSDDITIDVVAEDAEGYQLQSVKLSGHIPGGETKVLLERVKMSKTVFDQVAEWQLMQ